MSSDAWLVTGAAGFLGSHLVDLLLAEGRRVVGLDDFSWGRPEHLARANQSPAFTLVRGDVRDPDLLLDLLRRHEIAVLAHLAALHFIPAAEADPVRAASINLVGTQAALHAANRAENLRTFLFASTGDVYAPSEKPHAEEDPLEPFNVYGLNKLHGERMIELAAKRAPKHRRFLVARLFNLYGPRETNPHIIPEILRQIRDTPPGANEVVLRLGNLWPTRDLVPVRDAARAFRLLPDAVPPGHAVVNVATGRSLGMDAVVRALEAIDGRPFRVLTDPDRVRPVERPHLRADVARLRKFLDWAPSPHLEEPLRELLRDHPHS